MTLFQDLLDQHDAYFANSMIKLTTIERLLFLSHATAIGKMWSFVRKICDDDEKTFHQKWDVIYEGWDDYAYTVGVNYNGSKHYVNTDMAGELYDTDLPNEVATAICNDVGAIYDNVEYIMKSFCESLGYELIWDEYNIKLRGHGIKTECTAWSDDIDPFFENIEYDYEP